MTAPTAAERIAAAQAGSVRDTARLLTIVENGGPAAADVARALTGAPRGAHVVGITGAPGAGKSTLTGAILRATRAGAGPPRMAVLAVDPSSPLTGGAVLGDRVRMADFATDGGVFIRSLASRGHLGGLSAGTPAAIDLMAALGFETVIVETVGVGQSEVDVMNLADTVAVVLAPGMGDAVQAAKAGIMEIADIVVVNKADHAGARTTVREVKAALALAERLADSAARHGSDAAAHHRQEALRGGEDGAAEPEAAAERDDWQVPVLTTIAETGSGVSELVAALGAHFDHLAGGGGLAVRRRRRVAAAIEAVVVDRLRRAMTGAAGRAELDAAAQRVIHGDDDTYRAAATLLATLAGR